MEINEPADQILNEYGALPPRFKVLSVIGKGATGVVLKAQDQHLERDVAVKLLSASAGEDSLEFARFTREIKLLSGLKHKNIVLILSSGLTDRKHPYHIQELLTGKTVAETLAEQPFMSAELFFQVFTQILEGLSYAHAENVVHRDIKPSNLIICPQDDGKVWAKLIDFGLATLADNEVKDGGLTGTGALLGTPLYMSPEQCRGEPAQSKSDIYGLACVMYQCLAGSTPFSGTTPVEIMYKHLNEEPPPLLTEGSDRSLADLVAGCLKKDPQARPTADEVLGRLNKLSQEFSGTLNNFHQKKPAKKRGSRYLLVAAGLCLCAGLLVCVLIENHKAAVEPARQDSRHEKAERQIEELRNTIERLQKRFDASTSLETRRELGATLCKRIVALANLTTNQAGITTPSAAGEGQPDGKNLQAVNGGQDEARQDGVNERQAAEQQAKLFERVISVCDSIGPGEAPGPRIYANVWLCSYARDQRRLSDSGRYIDAATAAAARSGKLFPELHLARARIDLASHDLPAAGSEIRLAIKEWNSCLDPVSFMNEFFTRNRAKTFNPQSTAATELAAVAVELQKESPAADHDKMLALKICNEISEFLLKHRFPSANKSVRASLSIMSAISSSSALDRRTRSETYKLASEEAAFRKDPVDAAKYRQLSGR
jgi:serine/threonine protein kinase